MGPQRTTEKQRVVESQASPQGDLQAPYPLEMSINCINRFQLRCSHLSLKSWVSINSSEFISNGTQLKADPRTTDPMLSFQSVPIGL